MNLGLHNSFLTALLLLAAAVSPASAQEASPEARAAFSAGVEASDASQWEAARGHFQRAYELSSRPIILLNLAAVLVELDEPGAAHAALERFLADASPDVRDPRAGDVRAMMSDIVASAVQLQVQVVEGAGDAQLNGRPLTEGSALITANTAHTLTLVQDGETVDETQVRGAPGETLEVQLPHVPSAEETARLAIDSESSSLDDSEGGNGVAIGLAVAAGVVVVAVAVVLAILLASPDAPAGFEGNLGRVEIR